MAIGLITHQDPTRKEDVTPIVTNVDYKSTPLLSGLAEATAGNTLHEWMTESYAAAGDNATAELSDATVVDLVQPTRVTNVVQMFRKVITVSDTERAVNSYTGQDPYTRQTQKKMVELARDVEKALMQGTRASGSSGVARRLDGVLAFITTNATARTSGTSLTETEFNDLITGVWTTASTDQAPDEVHTGMYLKRVISGFTAGSTKYIYSEDKRLTNTADVYESENGVVKLFLHREVPTNTIVALDSSKWRVAYLQNRRFRHRPLAVSGDYTKGMIDGELTLEALNEKSSAKRSGYFVG
jgi:hypothetical protein